MFKTTCKLLILMCSFLFSLFTNGQISINKPVLGFTEICASPTFNTFSLSFTFSPVANVNVSNNFIIELSNSTGDFTTATQLTTSTMLTSPVTVSFSIPTNTTGNAYKIRVRSTAPVSQSPPSDAFSANYAIYNQPFTINNNTSSHTFCDNSSYYLAIDNGINSPLQHPQLTYKWYRNGVLISGQTASSYTANQGGEYYCKVDYGSCVLNAYSNIVTLTQLPSETLAITSAGNATVMCGNQGLVLSSSNTAITNVYRWYYNNAPITGATNATYTATMAGSYYLKITNNPCINESNLINLTLQNINVTLNPTNAITIIPGQPKVISCTTDAISPTYKWYKDNVLIIGQTANSISVNQSGTYKVNVKQNSPTCITEKEVSTVVSYPTNYNLTITHGANYADCTNNTITLNAQSFTTNTSENVLTAGVPISYQWYKDNTAITGATSNTYTVASYLGNGSYVLKATLTGGQVVSSNALIVKLKINVVLSITTNGFVCNSSSTVAITPSIQNVLFTYNWFKQGNATVQSTSMIYTVNEIGDYYLKISYQGCEITSNTLAVEGMDASLLVTNYDTNIELTEGEEITISASGADSYVWTVNTIDIGTGTSYTVNTPQEITLTAWFGLCQVTRIFTVIYTQKEFNLFIPNTITPNNDGKNDTWIIPEEFAYRDNVKVVIFSESKEILYQSANYQNDWPQEAISDKRVYYYKIFKDRSEVEKGSISVIK